MSGPILFGENLVTFKTARIARRDVSAVRDAADLLASAQRIRDKTSAASEAARAQGYQDGRNEAQTEYSSALADALSTLAAGFARENARREKEVAAAAMEVITQLIGERSQPDIVAGLAAQALAKADAGESDCIIEVTPDLLEPVREKMGALPAQVQLRANTALGPLGCRVFSGEGVIVADLDTQLQTLRDRWGLSASAKEPESAHE